MTGSGDYYLSKELKEGQVPIVMIMHQEENRSHIGGLRRTSERAGIFKYLQFQVLEK